MNKVKYRGTVLVVDDDGNMQELIHAIMDNTGLEIITAKDGRQALSQCRNVIPDIILLDIKMPGMNGMEVLKKIKEEGIPSVIIMMTAYADINMVIQAMKLGAYEFLTKPFNNQRLISAIDGALTKKCCIQEIEMVAVKGKSLSELMGKSNSIQDVIQSVDNVAKTDYTVIIEGETGTGKELIASAIYKQSKRHNGPFIIVDCGAIPETLIESEIFGHEKGAFTGAHQRKHGYFYLANHGTIFFDEIHNLPLTSQCKFLRAIEERMIHPVGGENSIPVDVRIIAATNLSLDREVDAGRFRNDLYHRLNEFCITLPPMRERKEDIIFIAERFVRETCGELKKAVLKFSDEAMEKLTNYPWLGNVREIRNVIRRAVLLSDNIIRPEDLSLRNPVRSLSPKETNYPTKAVTLSTGTSNGVKTMADNKDVDRAEPAPTLKDVSNKAMAGAEIVTIYEALKRTNGNKSKAAKLLNVDYKTLHYKIKNYKIEKYIP